MGNSASTSLITYADGTQINPQDFPSTKGKTCEISPGKVIGYETYGAENGKTTLFFFHGTPGSRFFFPPQFAQLCAANDIHVFVLERPGFGLSSPAPTRTILNWAEDVKAFANALNISKFSILGYSAGGPYALACAAKIPPSLLDRVLVVSSLSPPEAPNVVVGMNLLNRVGWFLSGNWKSILGHVIASEAKEVKGNPQHKLKKMFHNAATVDIEKFDSNPTIQRLFTESALEMYSRDAQKSEADEYWLFAHDWGFKLQDIPESVPVYLWSGTQDQSTTHNMAKYIAASVPGCRSKLVENQGHLLFFDLYEEFISTLTTDNNHSQKGSSSAEAAATTDDTNASPV